MKHIFKQLGATALALAVTVCGVTALGANAASGSSPVGYTVDYTTYEPDETIETIGEIVDGYLPNCFVQASLVFRNNTLGSLELEEKNSGYMEGTLHNVPASDTPYYFVIDYEAHDASGFYYGVKSKGNYVYSETGGEYFAFTVSQSCDVSFSWYKGADEVEITGDGVTVTDSNLPFTGLDEGSSEPTEQQPEEPTEEPTVEPTIYIMPFYQRSITAEIAFMGNALQSKEFGVRDDNYYIQYVTLENVPVSSEPYHFVIPYTTFDGGWFIDGIKTNGNDEYQTTGGYWFDFTTSKTCDVTVEWNVYTDTVTVSGDGATMVDCEIPFEGLTQQATSPYPPVTYPTSVPVLTTGAADSTTAPNETSFRVGDVNRDNVININDATMIQRYLAKYNDFDDEQLILADATGDGLVTIKDATEIQKYIALLPNSLTP